MFTKKVTDDDNFMALSSSAQALYLHLTMSADDDGFCNQVSLSMFKAHASVQDLQALLEKRYILQFEDGVIVIKHWRMANSLRKDRYTPTAFKEDLARLELKENGSYSWLPNGCQVVAERLPQNRLDKDRIVEDREDKDNKEKTDTIVSVQKKKSSIESEFDEVWKLYPKKQGKKKALQCYIKARKDGVMRETIEQKIRDYTDFCNRTNRYLADGSTWFNQARWEDDYTENVTPVKQMSHEDEMMANIERWKKEGLWDHG